jgi:sugar (pentulose or hexulose) kinase
VPEVTRILIGGGITKSKEFMEMMANVLGREIHVPVIRDSAFVGAVISALVALGRYPNHQAAVADIVQFDVFTPDEKIAAEYQKIYKRWVSYKVAIDKL